MSNKKYLIVIVGPTAIGKTSMAIEVAKHFNTEILSSDSRQFYKEMQIGTAVPSQEELSAVKHHFIQHLSVHQAYSVGDFERDAIAFIDDYFKTHNTLVMVGGSGLYEKAVTQGLDEFPEVDSEIRKQLNDELDLKGLTELQEELKEADPSYYEEIDLENPHRVIRALEIIRGTGKPFSSFLSKNSKQRNFEIIKIGLTLERSEIYDRINRRVDLMMEEGLLEEVKNLYSLNQLNALNTVGYSELFNYLDEVWDLEFAVSEIKKNTRRFAKRQLTWYRKDEQLTWFNPKEKQEVIEFIEKQINASTN
ncbi:tRNA (adenosine(37)-N6)-dimethylallyltransferase MiaA [Weeksellaceae bacterium KMM 9724]|uniref:tRNA (adenosine(37)-N6)-dimethylallyltransferase MiaA n=1 Tax=Profundicola chukchiensis TaxID=2961959 RepID=UPI00243987E5|nr:tRNA (adenosine(37)-N6)-dimethylallyltransferase MiaA [Profundicola chukchiensis]MDG4949718.1 tRNA (adenosine(37)-N6)-dimethylallyltransferase MiaA [Profundicola chukchiensis]